MPLSPLLHITLSAGEAPDLGLECRHGAARVVGFVARDLVAYRPKQRRRRRRAPRHIFPRDRHRCGRARGRRCVGAVAAGGVGGCGADCRVALCRGRVSLCGPRLKLAGEILDAPLRDAERRSQFVSLHLSQRERERAVETKEENG